MPVQYFGHLTATKQLFNQQLVSSPPAIVGWDIETISLKERMPIGFSIATSPEEAWYFRTYPEVDAEVELVLPLLRNPAIKKAIHNAPYDLRCFPLIAEIDRTSIADTNVMARLLGRTETRLFDLAPEIGMYADTVQMLLGPGQNMLDLPLQTVATKCATDAKVALALYHYYLPDIDSEYFAVEMEVIPILIDMSLRGLRVNQADRAVLEAKLEDEVEFYRRICEAEDFNPASNQQVGYILAKRGNFLPMTRSHKSLKVDEEQLEFLDDPLAAAVLSFRKANKLLTTYIRPLKDEDRIYTEYNLEAVVGRISSSNRNMQNIPPGDARNIFMPDGSCFTTGDFNQEHLRIIAYMTQDREMLRVYEEGEHGGDIHAKTSMELNISRRLAKVINYAIPYGATPRTVSLQAKTKDLRKCSAFLDSWFETFRGAAEWIKGAQEEGLRTGWALPTLFGRNIRIPEENEDAMKRKAVNYPILGSDGEIMKRALIMCKHLPLAVTVHDSITVDGDCEFPIEELENIAPVRIPFECKQTLRWE